MFRNSGLNLSQCWSNDPQERRTSPEPEFKSPGTKKLHRPLGPTLLYDTTEHPQSLGGGGRGVGDGTCRPITYITR
jgi:hypothetical protein